MTGVTQTQITTVQGRVAKQPPTSRQHRASSSVPGRQHREASSTPEVLLHHGQMAAAWTALSHPYTRMCLNEMDKRLFSGAGIVAFQGDEPRTPSPAFQTVLQRDFVPFVRDALKCIMAFGVVPIAFRRAIGSGLGDDELVPYVPVYGTYNISTWTELGLQRFRFYWTGSNGLDARMPGGGQLAGLYGPFGDPDGSVMVAGDFGYQPNVDGSLTSNMWAIAQELAFIGQLNSLALVGESIAANPPLITAYNPAIEDQAENRFGENFFAGDSRCIDRAEAVYQRTAQQQAVFREQMQQWEQVNGLSAAEEFRDREGNSMMRGRRGERELEGAVAPAWARDWRGHEMPWSRQYYLDPTRQLVQHQLPRPRSDLVNLTSQAMDIVCGVLNVPRGMLSSDTAVRAGVEAVAESMHRTVNRWADVLSTLMTNAYNHSFGLSDLRDELRIRMERKRRSPYDSAAALLTEEDLFAAESKTRVYLRFDVPPVTTPERLDALYNRGMLTWKTYGQSQLRLHGFARSQLASPTDPLTKAEQRQLLLGTADAGGTGESSPKKRKSSSTATGAKKKKKVKEKKPSSSSSSSDAGQEAANTAREDAKKPRDK